MTVSNTTNKHYYNGTGAQVSFPYAFKVFSSSDLTVYVDNILKTVDVDYSVSDVGEESGGNVVFTSAPASGTGNVAILRKLPLSQLLDLVQYGKFDAEVIEESFDRLVYVAQQLQEASDRTIRFAATVSDGNPQEITDTATDRAGKVLAYDSAGDLTVAQELGEWKGDWITATQYYVRDLIKDSATDNVYIALTNHVSAAAIGTDIGSNLGLVIDAAAVAANAATATTQAGIATTKAGVATTQAGIATTKAGEAATSATTATTQAGIATTKAGVATTQAGTATTQAGIATTKAGEASTSAGTATTQAGIATTQAGIATTKAGEASTSAGTATTQAGIATTKAGEASTSAGTATTQAGIATTKAGEAATSATTATTQASTATTQAGISTTKASESSVSAAAALASKLAAASSANDINVAAIDATISDTAVDVFVYDTSKDSDGGAWRKRTQGTSWYNETLNTSTRGSRKEFPAVAVIVAESNQVTIYDGDDPSMPMWMVFTGNTAHSGGKLVQADSSRPLTSIVMSNGLMAWSIDSNWCSFAQINYISEEASGDYLNFSAFNVATRNEGLSINTGGDIAIFSYANDVAMTVLPNAPIDSATGLPIPTIAVATNGGVSVIKDDGSVVDKTVTVGGSGSSYNKVYDIQFTSNNDLSFYHDRGYGKRNNFGIWPLSNWGADYSSWDFNGGSDFYVSPTMWPTGIGAGSNTDPAYTGIQSLGGDNLALAKAAGLSVFDINNRSRNDSSVAYITSDYNTGWMNGDIKLAALSDTDDTDVTGSELVTNGTFDTDVSGWTAGKLAGAADGILSVDTNRLKITNGSPDGYGTAYQSVTVEVGKTYTFSVNFTVGNASKRIVRLGTGLYNTSYVSDAVSSGATDEVITHTFVATSTNLYISLANYGTAGNYSIWDNVSLRLADQDRSVNGNGLAVHGTIQKNPVATGAELVGYSGFSASNYLEQPYNADLDFGTGDFSAMGWFKSNTTVGGNQPLFMRGITDTNSLAMIEPYIRADGKVDVLTRDAAEGLSYYTSTINILTQNWVHWCMVRSSGVMSFYVNGVHAGSAANTRNVTPSTSAKKLLRLGSDVSLVKALPGSAALLRISATAPSAEQIEKIYEDEKVLFQENAKATLYGSSDAVTALAHDDDTSILSVGTSSGRSDFQGLRRVSNTTTGVTTAISSSNGMMVEQ